MYVTGENDIAEFARPEHTLTVTLGGSGSGAVGDQTGAITCPTTCSHAYAANSQVTLTAAPSSGSTFSGWSGACSGAGSCQLTMSDDMQVTATFTAIAPPTVGAPTPVLTGAPSAVTDSAAGFQGSVNPDGLATTVYFQYGLDRRYSQPGASGPNYTQQTPPQSIGPDFSVHGIGPVAVSGLVPNALYHVRIVATNSAGTTFGPDITFTTATAPSPGAPTLGKTFNIAPVSGLVLVLVHGHLVPLTQLQQIGPGTTIDTRHGTLELITAGAGGGGAHDSAARRKQTQIGRFGGAVIRIRQTKLGPNKGMTTVMVVEGAFKGAPSYALCKKRGREGGRRLDGRRLEQGPPAAARQCQRQVQDHRQVQRGDRPRHEMDDRRPLRRHPGPRHHRLGRGHRLRPPQDDHPARRPELSRAGAAKEASVKAGHPIGLEHAQVSGGIVDFACFSS